MQITLYGTGSCTPTPKTEGKPFRSHTGWYVEVGGDGLLFDIGAGLLHKMVMDGQDIIKKPTHLFISHFHIDHTSDVIPLMQARLVYNREFGKVVPLSIGGPEGLNTFLKNIFEGVEKWRIDSQNIFELIEAKETGQGIVFDTENWKVTCAPVKHFDGVAYKLTIGGKSIIYTGDMGYDDRLIEFGKNANLAIMECSYPDSRAPKHLSPEDIGKLAALGHFKKIVLTHMYPEIEGQEDEIIKKIKAIAGAEVIAAHDLMKIDI
jgi:ribonuclease BN (tRNA processing enzyme)